MGDLRHSGPLPVTWQPATDLRCRATAATSHNYPPLRRREPLTCHQFVTKMPRNMLSMRNMQSCFGVPKLLSFP
jgi:hypothetical protein